MLNVVKQEPVMFQAVIQAALALALSFGLKLSPGQVGAVLAFTAAVLSFWTRTQVTPTTNPKDAEGSSLVRLQAAARQ